METDQHANKLALRKSRKKAFMSDQIADSEVISSMFKKQHVESAIHCTMDVSDHDSALQFKHFTVAKRDTLLDALQVVVQELGKVDDFSISSVANMNVDDTLYACDLITNFVRGVVVKAKSYMCYREHYRVQQQQQQQKVLEKDEDVDGNDEKEENGQHMMKEEEVVAEVEKYREDLDQAIGVKVECENSGMSGGRHDDNNGNSSGTIVSGDGTLLAVKVEPKKVGKQVQVVSEHDMDTLEELYNLQLQTYELSSIHSHTVNAKNALRRLLLKKVMHKLSTEDNQDGNHLKQHRRAYSLRSHRNKVQNIEDKLVFAHIVNYRGKTNLSFYRLDKRPDMDDHCPQVDQEFENHRLFQEGVKYVEEYQRDKPVDKRVLGSESRDAIYYAVLRFPHLMKKQKGNEIRESHDYRFYVGLAEHIGKRWQAHVQGARSCVSTSQNSTQLVDIGLAHCDMCVLFVIDRLDSESETRDCSGSTKKIESLKELEDYWIERTGAFFSMEGLNMV